MKYNIQRLATEITLEELQLHIIECLSNNRHLCFELTMELLMELLDNTSEQPHPLARINPQELTTSLVQDAVINGITDVSKYIYIKDKLTQLDGALNKLELFKVNPYFRIGRWEEMVETIARKTCCKCKSVEVDV